jgi:ribosome-associated protein
LERISRTQRKKQAQLLQKLGERLVLFDDAVLDAIGLPGALNTAVKAARGIKQHEARRRQFQYIGRLMREFEVEAADLESAIERCADHSADEKRKFKLAESWRDQLLSGDCRRFDWLVETYPQLDPENVRRLIDSAIECKLRKGSNQAARTLFRLLRQLLD